MMIEVWLNLMLAYLSTLLEQYGLAQKNSNKGPKKW